LLLALRFRVSHVCRGALREALLALAALFLGLGSFRRPGACVALGGKKMETQTHADKQG
jgi:hypothetical protein